MERAEIINALSFALESEAYAVGLEQGPKVVRSGSLSVGAEILDPSEWLNWKENPKCLLIISAILLAHGVSNFQDIRLTSSSNDGAMFEFITLQY